MEYSTLLLYPALVDFHVAVALAALVVAVFSLQLKFTSRIVADALEIVGGKKKKKGEWLGNSLHVIKLELLAAKNLVATVPESKPDPYALITCGGQKRFSSMVPGSGNPMWGEEFNFVVDALPATVDITIFDWDVSCKSRVLGSAGIPLEPEGQTGAVWHALDQLSAQVCLHIKQMKLSTDSAFALAGFAELDNAKNSKALGPTMVHQKPGPLQRIYNLPPEEVVEHNYSCSLGGSLLHGGHLYVSAMNICFHSNGFTNQMKVIIPFRDVDEIRKSQQALMNPAITIILHKGACENCNPPPTIVDGKPRYRFASFWNRNHTFRSLQRAASNYTAMLEEKKQEASVSSFRSLASFAKKQCKISDDGVAKAGKPQAFVKESVLESIIDETFPCTVEKFFARLLDDSTFMSEYRSARKDTKLSIGPWRTCNAYDGQIREVTFRSPCENPMCPPDTAVTACEHAVISSDKTSLVFETVQQAHDIPFGSHFEVHCKWTLKTTTESSCSLNISVGARFKKWCVMQIKIKRAVVEEHKKEIATMLEMARSYLVQPGNESSKTNKTSISPPQPPPLEKYPDHCPNCGAAIKPLLTSVA